MNQHLGICGYEKLWKEVDGLKKQIKFLETSDLINTYKKSDCFISTGLSQKDPVQRSLVQKYAFTVFDLKFPVTLGAINSQDITLFSLLSDSLFQASFSSAKVKSQCQLDINHEEVSCNVFRLIYVESLVYHSSRNTRPILYLQ